MVSERTGLDAVVLAALECLDEVDARPDGRYVKSAKVVDRMYASRGIPPRHGYDAICYTSAPWLVHVRLIDFFGNLGSPDPNDEAAAPRYTEVRLSPAGSMALAAERGELPRLPIRLINGDLALGGTSPPFDPARLLDAFRAAATGAATDTELVETLGLPAFPTWCSVAGDLTALASGARTLLRLSADVAIETHARAPRLVLSHFPLGVGPEAAAQSLAARADAARTRDLRATHPELHDKLALPLRDVRNESVDLVGRVVCELWPGADAEMCREGVLQTWPVMTTLPVQLPATLPTLVREFAAQHEAIAALLAP
jgi:DNA gyrase/topoisomerase IV subunit A